MELADFEFVCDLVRRQSGIALDSGKQYLVESRLQPLARRLDFDSIHDIVNRLRTSNSCELQKAVVDAMTTNETSFFRDIQPFEALRKVILPDLITKRAATKQLRIWCAACSTGQEPFTIAMVIRELFPQLATWEIQILATDLCSAVLDRAKSASFNQIEVNRGLPTQYVLKYFERHGLNWQLKQSIREMIEFRQLNLIENWPAFAQMDIIFIRNVLIYFDVATKKTILGKIRRQLRQDGYLFLGSAESTNNLDDSFSRMSIDKATAYRLQ